MQTSDNIKVTGIIELPTKSKKKMPILNTYLLKCSVCYLYAFTFSVCVPFQTSYSHLGFKGSY